jgi:hypothetical protein
LPLAFRSLASRQPPAVAQPSERAPSARSASGSIARQVTAFRLPLRSPPWAERLRQRVAALVPLAPRPRPVRAHTTPAMTMYMQNPVEKGPAGVPSGRSYPATGPKALLGGQGRQLFSPIFFIRLGKRARANSLVQSGTPQASEACMQPTGLAHLLGVNRIAAS